MDADKLTEAAAKGNTERVQFLLENGIAPNAVNRFGRTAIQVQWIFYYSGSRKVLFVTQDEKQNII